MKFFNAFLVFILCLCISQTCYSDKFSGATSRWPVIQTNALAVPESDNYAYVGDGDTINIFDKTTLERVSYLRLSDASEGFRALLYFENDDNTKSYLIGACGYSGIQVIEVTDVNYPISRKTILTSNNPSADSKIIAYDIVLHGNFLFVADLDYALRVFDISAPESPREVCWLDLSGNARETPLVPLNVGVYSTDKLENVWAIIIAETSVGPIICRFQVIGLEGNTPTIKVKGTATNLPPTALVTSFFVDGNYAYCMDAYLQDLYVFDVSHDNYGPDPDNPEEDADLSPELIFAQSQDDDYEYNPLFVVNPRGFVKYGNDLYLTAHGLYEELEEDQFYGINRINISSLFEDDGKENFKPYWEARFGLSGANSLVVDSDSAYVTSSWHGFVKMRPLPLDNLYAETMINAYDISIEKENGIIYVCDNRPTTEDESHGITILRVKPKIKTVTDEDTGETTKTVVRQAGPALPVKEGYIETPGTAKATCFDPSLQFAYIADGTSGIHVLDLSTANEESGPGNPELVSDSTIPAPVVGGTTYEVFDVSVEELITDTSSAKYLMALTTNPDGEVMIIDVTSETSVGDPIEYEPQTINLDGDTIPKRIIAYEYNDSLCALVARGTDGLTILNLNPDWENPDQVLTDPGDINITHMDFDNALSVYAYNNDYENNLVNNTGIFAYLANGEGGVVIIQLFETTNLANINPSIINTIDTSAYGNAIDVHIYQTTASRILYVLTDNPYNAVLIYDLEDFENPVLKGSTSTFGQSSTLWATEFLVNSEASTSGYVTIRGVFIADGHGGVAFRQVTDESAYNDRIWDDNSTKFCFISNTSGTDKSGLIPIFGLCLFWLALLGVFALRIRSKNTTMS